MHAQQEKFRNHAEDLIVAIGGNRSGKTTGSKLILADIVRRRHAINRRLCLDLTTKLYTRNPYRPLEIWIGVPSLDKFRMDWLYPADRTISIQHYMGDLLDERMIHEHPDLWLQLKTRDKIVVKSYEQGWPAFEMSEVDVVFLSEEPPDPKIVNSCFSRVATSNGVVIMDFIPLNGFTWTYHRWFKPMVKLGGAKKVSDREWVGREGGRGGKGRSIAIVQMGMADNPRAVDEAERLEADPGILPREKAARLYGDYGYAEGVFLPRISGLDLLSPGSEHKQYVVDELPKIVASYLIADPNYRTGAILASQDGDGNLFLRRQHLEEDWVTRQHAEVFREWLGETPQAFQYADMGAAGKYATCELHAEGLPFQPVPKGPDSVPRSIKMLRGLTIPDPVHVHPITGERGAPRIYFYRPELKEKYEIDGMEVVGSRLIDEMGSARQTDDDDARPETPHKTQKHSLDLFDCVRYLMLVYRPFPVDEGDVDKRPMNRVSQNLLPTGSEIRRWRDQDFDPDNVDFGREPVWAAADPWFR